MTVEFRVDKKNNLLVRKIGGEVSVAEVMEDLQNALRHPDYKVGMKSLTDLRDYVPTITSSEIREIADYLLADAEARKGMSAAIVVSQKVSYGLMRMLQELSENPEFSISVFYDIDEAKQWLGVS